MGRDCCIRILQLDVAQTQYRGCHVSVEWGHMTSVAYSLCAVWKSKIHLHNIFEHYAYKKKKKCIRERILQFLTQVSAGLQGLAQFRDRLISVESVVIAQLTGHSVLFIW